MLAVAEAASVPVLIRILTHLPRINGPYLLLELVWKTQNSPAVPAASLAQGCGKNYVAKE